MIKRKVTIVIEDTDAGFNIYLDGDWERLGTVPNEQLSTAEWWGQRLFGICVSALKDAGVIKSEMKRMQTPSQEKRH